MSDSVQPHRRQPTKLPHPWDSPSKNTGVSCHFLLQGIFPTQGSNLGLPPCRQTLYHLSYWESPIKFSYQKLLINPHLTEHHWISIGLGCISSFVTSSCWHSALYVEIVNMGLFAKNFSCPFKHIVKLQLFSCPQRYRLLWAVTLIPYSWCQFLEFC